MAFFYKPKNLLWLQVEKGLSQKKMETQMCTRLMAWAQCMAGTLYLIIHIKSYKVYSYNTLIISMEAPPLERRRTLWRNKSLITLQWLHTLYEWSAHHSQRPYKTSEVSSEIGYAKVTFGSRPFLLWVYGRITLRLYFTCWVVPVTCRSALPRFQLQTHCVHIT